MRHTHRHEPSTWREPRSQGTTPQTGHEVLRLGWMATSPAHDVLHTCAPSRSAAWRSCGQSVAATATPGSATPDAAPRSRLQHTEPNCLTRLHASHRSCNASAPHASRACAQRIQRPAPRRAPHVSRIRRIAARSICPIPMSILLQGRARMA